MDQHGCFVVELGLGLQTHLGASLHPLVLRAPKAGLCGDSVEVGSERPRRLSKVAQLQRNWASHRVVGGSRHGERQRNSQAVWEVTPERGSWPDVGVKVGEMPRLLGWGRWSSFGTRGPCRWVDSWVHI